MKKYWICYFVIFLGLITIHFTHEIQYGINISSLIIDCSAAVHMWFIPYPELRRYSY